MIWRILLAVLGIAVGLWYIALGFILTIGFFGERDQVTVWSLAAVAVGMVLAVWSVLGAIRPTKWRFITPAIIVSMHVGLWLSGFVV